MGEFRKDVMRDMIWLGQDSSKTPVARMLFFHRANLISKFNVPPYDWYCCYRGTSLAFGKETQTVFV